MRGIAKTLAAAALSVPLMGTAGFAQNEVPQQEETEETLTEVQQKGVIADVMMQHCLENGTDSRVVIRTEAFGAYLRDQLSAMAEYSARMKPWWDEWQRLAESDEYKQKSAAAKTPEESFAILGEIGREVNERVFEFIDPPEKKPFEVSQAFCLNAAIGMLKETLDMNEGEIDAALRTLDQLRRDMSDEDYQSTFDEANTAIAPALDMMP